MSDFPEGLTDFYLSKLDQLYKNPVIRKKILDYNKLATKVYFEKKPKDLFKRVFLHYLNEAELTLSLLKDEKIDKRTKLLEVGAGLGLVYGYLKKLGYQIYGIEPSAPGFGDSYKTGQEILKELKIEASGWQPYRADEADKIKTKMDIIFSNNVLEHILGLEESLKALARIMKKDGVMIHNTMNYLLPYDPHFKILLVPFFPKLTGYLKPRLKKTQLWGELNFVTPGQLRRAAKKCGLRVDYKNGILVETLKRLETDKEFSQKHKQLLPVYYLVKKLGGLRLIKSIPATLKTPMVARLKKV